MSLLGRNTQGVRLIALRGEERLNGIARIAESADGDQDVAEDEGGDG